MTGNLTDPSILLDNDAPSIGDIAEPPPSPTAEDATNAESADEDVARKKQVTRSHKIDNDLREEYCHKLFRLVRAWLFFVAVFALITRFRWRVFEASDALLIALLGTTTANVIGLFAVVAGWLFPKRKGRDN